MIRKFTSERKRLYTSNDAGKTWQPVDPTIYSDRSIVGIVSMTDTDGARAIYVAATRLLETETPLAEENLTTTADETNAETTSEQPAQTDPTLGAENTDTETASAQTNAFPIKTIVHWHLEGATFGWEERSATEQVVYALTGVDRTVNDVESGVPILSYTPAHLMDSMNGTNFPTGSKRKEHRQAPKCQYFGS